MILLKTLGGVLFLLFFLVIGFVQLNKVDDIPVERLKTRWTSNESIFVTIESLSLHVMDEGPKDVTAPPIVLIHGTGASLHTWNGWVDALKQERRVIRFDLPGFGLTGPEPENNYTIERYTDYVIALLDKLKVERAVLAGNSLGGYIAWATAIRYPDKVDSLVLIDASGYPYEAESVPLAFKLSQNKLAKTLLKNFLPKFIIRKSIENVYGSPDLVTDQLVNRYYELSLREGNRAAIKERFVQTKPGPLIAKLADLQIPTLILWGKKDKLIPMKFAQRFNEDIPNSQLVIFDELGHVPHEEAPLKTVAPVLSFIE